MLIGTVTEYDQKRGFGYIKEADKNKLFVHFSAIIGDGFKTLTPGEKVQYVVVNGQKGPQAAKVQPIETN
ncbi:cold shock domain-containing protein [Nicoliella spurrieriana]|uniref:Cold shock domain-containing protein n=1 Tax=Nicoliella spurrieriana TaxID=2925830 RepID=A0A976X4Y5_9LACO|nr:cold shock domain-containing protein [Nicoliella spurrieriana]UQS86443.1 cold shock domain-containing protein [Nicoliella spurrieriana]